MKKRHIPISEIPPRTLAQVKETIAQRKLFGHDPAKMARLMLRHGRMTDEARAYLAREYGQGGSQ